MKHKKLALSFFMFCMPMALFAWNAPGHKTSGVIAYDYLKQNSPNNIIKIINTLTYHPWYYSQWADQLKNLSGEQKDIELFELASVFPDEARGTDLGNGEKTKWHYVDYPYVPEGQNVKGLEPQSPNAQEKILELLQTLKTEKEGEQKALDICWLFHLIEDIHQPLHCTMMFDNNHPNGDKGGNATFIIIGTGEEQNLHHFWDAVPIEEDANYTDKAKELMQQYPVAKLDELKAHTDVISWIKDESVPLAIKYSYMNGKVNGTKEAPTQLSADYQTTSKEVAERRVVLSGIRLAQQLMNLYSGITNVPNSASPVSTEKTVTTSNGSKPSATLQTSDAKNYEGKTVTVCGVVSGVHSGSTTYINFDKPYPDQTFTAVIFSSSKNNFTYDLKTLEGKSVCVSGEVTMYNGKPEIKVSAPEQIEKK